MSTPARPSIFKAWLTFFVVSTTLVLMASYVATKALTDEGGEGAGSAQVAYLLISALVTYMTFQWVVIRDFVHPDATPAVLGRDPAPLPIFLPWLRYFVVSTIASYILSVFVGVMVGAVALQTRTQLDLTDWRVYLLAVVFGMAPPSWASFRWVASRYYVPNQGAPTVPPPA